jgi:hypothetical protein
MFSAEADVCTPSRGIMLPRTMQRLVGSQAWMDEGIVHDEIFEDAAKALESDIAGLSKRQKRKSRLRL